MTATTPEPKTWGRSRVSGTDLNREVRDQIRDLQSRINALTGGGGGSLFPTGAIIAWGGGSVPTGWLLCDGRTVPRIDYLALWNEIGTAYNVGGESALDFRLPKLFEAIPRGGSGSSDGVLNTRGLGGGANSLVVSHSVTIPAANSTTTGNQSNSHAHGAFSIHDGSSHTHAHGHNFGANTGGHNHGRAHNHNLPVQNNTVTRNTGSNIRAIGHNHSCDAVSVGTGSDGAHNHGYVSFTYGENVTTLSNDTGNFSSEAYDSGNANLHSHGYSHTHSWTGDHDAPLNTIPESISVNYLVKA